MSIDGICRGIYSTVTQVWALHAGLPFTTGRMDIEYQIYAPKTLRHWHFREFAFSEDRIGKKTK
jgi:hypothetical protein